jgi:hypothetical protein
MPRVSVALITVFVKVDPAPESDERAEGPRRRTRPGSILPTTVMSQSRSPSVLKGERHFVRERRG